MTTAQAAALAGMSPAAFRKAMTLERRRGRDYRQPRESWPDARTPLWDADAVSAWNQTRARRNNERKAVMNEWVEAQPRRAGKSARAVEQFNARFPVGTPVLYWPGVREGEGREGVTRSPAWLMGGHSPVVTVDGYPGGIALTHVVVPESKGSAVRGEHVQPL